MKTRDEDTTGNIRDVAPAIQPSTVMRVEELSWCFPRNPHAGDRLEPL